MEEERNKRFDEKFPSDYSVFGDGERIEINCLSAKPEQLKDFIQLEIDLAVSKERSRIVSIVDMYFEEEKSSNTGSRLVYEHIADDKERVINLINTK